MLKVMIFVKKKVKFVKLKYNQIYATNFYKEEEVFNIIKSKEQIASWVEFFQGFS